MKKLLLVILPAFLIFMGGCSPEKADSSYSEVTFVENKTEAGDIKTNKIEVSQNESEETADPEQNEAGPAHLELVEEADNCPVYYLTFKKVGDAGGSIQTFDPMSLITTEPEMKGIWSSINEDADLLTIGFWNVKDLQSVTFRTEDMEYEFTIPKTSPKEYSPKQRVQYGDYSFLVDNVKVYPKAVLLHVTDVNNARLFMKNFLLKYDGSTYPPAEYSEDDTGRTFLFVLEDTAEPDKIEGLKIGTREDYSEFSLSME